MTRLESASDLTSASAIGPEARPSAEGDVPALDIDAVVSRVEQMSSLPQVAAKVIEAASDETCDAADMRHIVESDPALSARVIQCVNSAAFGLQTKISSLQRAISYLGFKQVRNLAVTASVAGIFMKDDQPIGAYNRADLWAHMVSVAVVSRMVAKRCGLSNFEEVFLAGLLHDVGIVLEDQYGHEAFVAMLRGLSPERTLCENERAALGFDHTMLGERVAGQWKFSQDVTDTIRHHHDTANYDGDHLTVVACVDVANLLCSVSERASVGVNLVRPSLASMEAIGLERSDLKVLLKDMEEEIESQEELFGLLGV